LAAVAVVMLIVMIIVLASNRKKPDPNETTAPVDTPVIHMAAAGDLNVTEKVIAAGGDSYDYTGMMLDVAHLLADADITALNFEGNFYGAPYGTDRSAPQALADALARAGVDVLQLANTYSIYKGTAGLSSTINAVVGKKGFARVSSVPGKTVFVNLFRVDEKGWLIDLPGYGYSKTSKEERDRYSRLIDEYLTADQDNIVRIYMIVDARHKPTADDVTMVQWVRHYGCPLTVVANKLDKLKKSEIEPNLARIRETLMLSEEDVLIPFSAEKGTNCDLLKADIQNAIEEN
jgi:GTP-binding protein